MKRLQNRIQHRYYPGAYSQVCVCKQAYACEGEREMYKQLECNVIEAKCDNKFRMYSITKCEQILL